MTYLFVALQLSRAICLGTTAYLSTHSPEFHLGNSYVNCGFVLDPVSLVLWSLLLHIAVAVSVTVTVTVVARVYGTISQ